MFVVLAEGMQACGLFIITGVKLLAKMKVAITHLFTIHSMLPRLVMFLAHVGLNRVHNNFMQGVKEIFGE